MNQIPNPSAESLRFYEKLEKDAIEFAKHQLGEHNMLESMAIVFSYPVVSSDLPTAIVVGQTGALVTPSEFIHVASQLHKTLVSVIQNGWTLINALDDQMAIRAKHLKQLESAIYDAEQRLSGSQPPATGREQ